MSLCIQYVHEGVLHFLQFVIYDFTGRELANSILDNLQKFGLNLNFLVGQGYDRAVAMFKKLRSA